MAQASHVREEKLKALPEEPGVYLFRDARGRILYIGKAKSLRDRVRGHFHADPSVSKPPELYEQIADVETIVTASEAEALLLESNLIKEYDPRFNVRLRDDKAYPYVKVTVNEPFPRVLVTRRVQKDGARYFGPYADVGAMRRALRAIKKLYTIRSCHYDLPQEVPDRPCLDYHIGRCKAPCVGWQTEADYRAMIGEVLMILEGRTQALARQAAERMQDAAAALQFERAAELRDVLRGLEALAREQVALDPRGGDLDAVAIAKDGDDACGVILKIREGRLLGREAHLLGNVRRASDGEILSAFVARHYVRQLDLPARVLFPFDFEDRRAVEEALAQKTGRRVRVLVPIRGRRRAIVERAIQNAQHVLEERVLAARAAAERAPSALHELRENLALDAVPRAILCFDVSTTQGADTVGAAVWFENGEPLKDEYRRFNVQHVAGQPDDFAAMEEVVERYFTRRAAENRRLPDLVVIDGGKGQLSAAAVAMGRAGVIDLPTIALAKREELIYLPDAPDPLRLPHRSGALRLLQRIRDEAHRFVLTHHRARRTRGTLVSELGRIPGIGPARQQALLRHFGSVRALQAATEEEIARVPGFGAHLAAIVARQLQGNGGEL
ncbi:MAG: excinuclease ABC subunit UvrC [Gemmatimonadetes bacterium]|nr:excinuclease ABC subunit UvrC [Gemmatimonadota bacterium]